MEELSASQARSRDVTHLGWCVAASVLMHALLLYMLPDWRRAIDTPPLPLSVELRETPAEIIPPKPLPLQPVPVPRDPVKPPPQKPVPRQEPLIEPPRAVQPAPAAPILTVPPEAPVTAATPVVPEQKPEPSPPPEPPRAPPVAKPAPITPPRLEARSLGKVEPPYPTLARRRGEQGTVVLRLTVTVEGLPRQVAVETSTGFPLLDNSALEYAKANWRFEPARQDGKPVEGTYTRAVVFRLD